MRKFKWIDLALLPYLICVGFLLVLGKLCGLTYKQISVVFNLWLQGVVLMLSGLAPAVAAVYRFVDNGSFLWIAVSIPLLAYATVYVYAFYKMLQHYHLPFDDAFNLCVMDLQIYAKRWKTTYQMVNLIIFVLFFLIIIGLNCLLTYYIIHF